MVAFFVLFFLIKGTFNLATKQLIIYIGAIAGARSSYIMESFKGKFDRLSHLKKNKAKFCILKHMHIKE